MQLLLSRLQLWCCSRVGVGPLQVLAPCLGHPGTSAPPSASPLQTAAEKWSSQRSPLLGGSSDSKVPAGRGTPSLWGVSYLLSSEILISFLVDWHSCCPALTTDDPSFTLSSRISVWRCSSRKTLQLHTYQQPECQPGSDWARQHWKGGLDWREGS